MMRGFRRRWAGAGGALALTVLLVACTLESRHDVLTFFFDGVPPLAGAPSGETSEPCEPAVVLSAPPVIGAGDKLTSPPWGVLPGLEGAERFARRRVADGGEGFYHQEMTVKQCLICHDESKGLEPVVEVSLEFCDKCHKEQRVEEGWNHGVINLGECQPCHRVGHESPYPYMLDKPVAELCLFCHQEDAESDWVPFHKTKALRIEQSDCTACHDPHRAL